MSHKHFALMLKKLFVSLILASGVFASGGDEMITVHFSGSGAFVQTGDPTNNEITFNVIEGRVAADPSIGLRTQTTSVSGSYGPVGMETPYVDLRVEVGRDYIMWMTAIPGAGAGAHIGGSGNFHVQAPPGYHCVFINQNSAFYPGTLYRFRIIPEVINDFSKFAGEAESFADGRLAWGVSLGTKPNGTSAGSIRLKDFGYESNWNSSGTRYGLKFVTDLPVYEPGTAGPEQIKAPQTLVKIVSVSANKYQMEFYSADNVSGTAYPFTTTSHAFSKYTIEKPSGFSTKLEITKDVYGASATTPVRTEKTSLLRSGTWSTTSNYTWTKQDWHSGSTPLITRTDTWATPTSGTDYEYTDTYSLSQAGLGVALSGSKKTEKFDWGEAITEVTVGGLQTDYEYYDVSTNRARYTRLKKATYPDKSYESYDYFLANENNMTYGGHTVTRPHSAGTETTTYWYEESDPDYPQRLQKVETKVGSQATSRTEFTYNSSYTANALAIVRTTREDYTSDTNDLDTITQYYLGPNDGHLKGQLFSIERSNKTKTVFAYHNGKWDDTAKTFSLSNPDGSFRIARINGTANSSSSGDAAPDYDSYSLTSSDNNETFKLEDGLSTMELEIRDINALLVRTEHHVWNSQSWNLVGKTDYDYDDDLFGRLTSRASSNNSTHSATYNNGLLATETLPSGATHTYSGHDVAGRPLTVTREALGGAADPVPAVVSTFKFDALGNIKERKATGDVGSLTHTWGYDSAGRLTSQSHPDTGSQTISYQMLTAGGSKRTVINSETNATLIEERNAAGQITSIEGTGVVHRHFSYTVPSGQLKTIARVGGSSSPRLVESWVDWLGRSVKTSQPGFVGQSSLVNEQEYNNLGQLIADRTSGSTEIQEILYEYDTSGRLVRSGLDIDKDTSNALSLSADRVTDHDSRIEYFGGAWWSTQRTTGYFPDTSSTAKAVTTLRSRLYPFSANIVSETRFWDADYADSQTGSQTFKTTVEVDRGNKKVTTRSWTGGFTNPEVRVTQNGALTRVLGSYSTADADSHTYRYDSLSRLFESTDPRTGTTTETAYKSNTTLVSGSSRPMVVAGSNSNTLNYATTSYSYNDAGLLTLSIDGKRTDTTNGSGDVINSVDATFSTSRREYDAKNRLIHQWGSGSNPVSYGYDSTYGDMTSMSTYRAGSNWDNDNWPISNTGTADTTQWNYHAASGQLLNKTAADSQAVTYGYDDAGRLSKRSWVRRAVANSSDPLDDPLETSYLYAPRTSELSNKNYNNNANTTNVGYTYTTSGQLKSVSDATGTRDLTYSATHPWQLETDDLAGQLGNRQLKRLYTSSGLIGQDGGYQLGTSGTNGNPAADVSHQWNYHGTTGRVDNVSHTFEGGTARTFSYAYESKSHLINTLSVAHAGGTYVADRGWDSKRNLLTELKSGFNGEATAAQFSYAYDGRGKRDWETRSGTSFNIGSSAVTIDYQYTSRGELEKALTYLGTDTAINNSALELSNLQHEYAYDDAGNRTSANQTGTSSDAEVSTFGNTNQHTSQQNKLLIAAGTVKASSTMAISLGNGSPAAPTREASGSYWTAAFDPANTGAAITADVNVWAATGGVIGSETNSTAIGQETQSITYYDGQSNNLDSPGLDGNLINDGIWEYDYDAENRLTSAESSLLNTTITFVYDYLGRRAEKTVVKTGHPTVTRRYVYDGWDLVGEYEYDSSSSEWWPVQAYAWGLNNASAKTHTGAAGALLQISHQDSKTATPEQYLPAYDANGNLMALYDATSKAAAAVYDYSPYGELIRSSGDFAALNPFRYSTKYTDNETKLVYFGHRYYSPKLGRFINRDPIEEAGGNNLLGYVGNDPVNREDILGLNTAIDNRSPFDPNTPSPPTDTAAPRVFVPAFDYGNPNEIHSNAPLRQVLWNTWQEEREKALDRKIRDQHISASKANGERNQVAYDESKPATPAISAVKMAAAANSLTGKAPDNAGIVFSAANMPKNGVIGNAEVGQSAYLNEAARLKIYNKALRRVSRRLSGLVNPVIGDANVEIRTNTIFKNRNNSSIYPEAVYRENGKIIVDLTINKNVSIEFVEAMIVHGFTHATQEMTGLRTHNEYDAHKAQFDYESKYHRSVLSVFKAYLDSAGNFKPESAFNTSHQTRTGQAPNSAVRTKPYIVR